MYLNIIFICFVQSFVADEQSQLKEISSVCVKENNSVDRASTTENTTENTSKAVPEKPNPTPSGPTPTIRRRRIPPELLEAENQMKETFSMLKNVITKKTNDKEDDEYDLFGKMLAKKIRKLPEHEREVFMYEVEGLYFNKVRRVKFSNSSEGSNINSEN